MDPITGAALAAGANAAGKSTGETTGSLLRLALSPAAEALGRHWGESAENYLGARRLAKKTKRKRDELGHDSPYSQRVAGQAIEAVAYSDDEMLTEYLSGVIASSEGPADDRGVSWTSLVARLSSDQLRLHYLLYAAAREYFVTTEFDSGNQTHQVSLLTPLDGLARQFDETYDEDPGAGDPRRIQDALHGLMREGLIAEGYFYGTAKNVPDPEYGRGVREIRFPFERALEWTATVHGTELYLWGLGYGSDSSSIYFDADEVVRISGDDEMTTPQITLGTVTTESVWVFADPASFEAEMLDDTQFYDPTLGPMSRPDGDGATE